MNREEVLKERRELLERLCNDFNMELFAAVMKEPETENEPPILRLMLEDMGYEAEDEALAEFFFLPLPEEEIAVQHFVAYITITDDLKDAHLPELFEVMSYINASIPCGSYAIDKEKHFLTFKLTVPLPMELSGDDLYKEMDAVAGNAIALLDVHLDTILKVMDGTYTVEHAMMFIN